MFYNKDQTLSVFYLITLEICPRIGKERVFFVNLMIALHYTCTCIY